MPGTGVGGAGLGSYLENGRFDRKLSESVRHSIVYGEKANNRTWRGEDIVKTESTLLLTATLNSDVTSKISAVAEQRPAVVVWPDSDYDLSGRASESAVGNPFDPYSSV